jgi:thiamine biosynthesis lipoprotein
MGTVVTFSLATTPDSSPPVISVALARARNVLHRADAVFSTWRANSPINVLRRGELELGECPPVVGELYQRCLEIREMTDGWFDPWAAPGGFDPTGLVKGWAAECACRCFAGVTLAGVIVNAAGDVATSGTMASGEAFRIGILDPDDRHRIVRVVTSPGAVATSGTAERGLHLFDPKSGLGAARAKSATVTGPSLTIADALATALAVAGSEGLAFVERAGYEGLVIDLDGRFTQTRSFPVTSR